MADEFKVGDRVIGTQSGRQGTITALANSQMYVHFDKERRPERVRASLMVKIGSYEHWLSTYRAGGL